jgi:hypothetical protein
MKNCTASPKSTPTSKTTACKPRSFMTARRRRGWAFRRRRLTDALRCVRPGAGFDHVHLHEPISRRHGSGAAILAGARRGLTPFICARPTAADGAAGAIAHYEPTTAPIAVNHQGQFPSVTLSFNLAPGIALSDAVKEIQQMEQKSNAGNDSRKFFGNAAGLPTIAGH